MQIFFALSGALFYLSFKKHPIVDFNRLLKTKFRRLIIPFGVIGLLYLIPVYYLIGHNNGFSFKEVLVHTLFNVEWGHIWFMPTLFWLMIYGCLIFKITPPTTATVSQYGRYQNGKNIKFIIFTSIFLFIFHFIGFPEKITPHFLCIGKSFMYSLIFFVGVFIEKYQIINKISRWQFLTIFIVFTILVMQKLLFPIKIDGFINSRLSLLVDDIRGISAIISIFWICNKMSVNIPRYVSFFDNKSYEIYLYSEPVNYLVISSAVLLGGWPHNGTIFYFIRFLCSLGVALFLSYVINYDFGQKSNK